MKKCKLENMHQRQKELGFERCIKCNLKIGLSFQEKVREEYERYVTEEMKTLFLQALSAGKTIGEAKVFAGIPKHEWDTLFTGRIIEENTRTIKFLDLGDKTIY